jgi:hypothetical protein
LAIRPLNPAETPGGRVERFQYSAVALRQLICLKTSLFRPGYFDAA